jgi:hypothetical protein
MVEGRRNIVRRVWRRPPPPFQLLLVVLAVLLGAVARAGEISCVGSRYTYLNKGLDPVDVPKTPQQGTYF